jgi:hypothetical protein
MEKPRMFLVTIVTASVLTGVVGVAAGSALGGVPSILGPRGVTPVAGGMASEPMPEPTYTLNDSGQTYGSARDATSPDGEPDLIAVIADDGLTEGFVTKRDLDDANGTTAMRQFRSPQDAIEWQNTEGRLSHTIPVFESDGSTQVGIFTVGPGGGDPGALPPLP